MEQKKPNIISVVMVVVGFAFKIIPLIGTSAPIRHFGLMMIALIFFTTFSSLITIYAARHLIYYSFPKISDTNVDTALSFSFFYLQIVSFVQLYSNMRGKLREPWFRTFITYPGSIFFFSCFTFLVIGMPLYLIINLILRFIYRTRKEKKPRDQLKSVVRQQNIRRGIFLFAVLMSLVGLYQSLTPGIIQDRKIKLKSPSNIILPEPFVLKIVQLSDIHLGPMMSVSQLQNISRQVVERRNKKKIDEEFVVLMTGDFFTTESHEEKTALSRGLEPLKGLRERLYACMGNHDHELADRVQLELNRSNVNLLVNQIDHIKITRGSARGRYIQIIGLDYMFPNSDPKAQIERFFTEHRKEIVRDDVLVRLVMLHNPSHFQYIPDVGDGITTAVFGGHFHGAQFKLPIFSDRTLISEVLKAPDYGWFCHGNDGSLIRLEDTKNFYKICDKSQRIFYAHTGTGYYGLPLRWGTQNENVSIFQFVIQ
jgi:predicted MPP superfamily phosphohydrolase